MIKLVKKYISKDPISFIHIEDLLDREHTILYASNNGFIIRDDKVNFIYISFDDEKIMKEVLSKYHFDSYLSYDAEVVKFYGDYGNTTNLKQWAYMSRKKFDVSKYDIRKLGLEYLDFINSSYKALGPDEDNREALENGEVLGLFVDNELAGMVGRHPEGCLGMLKVFDKYRRKGYGEALEKAKINDLIDRNQRVFEEVIEGNDASSFLQAKLGLVQGEKTIYWKL